MAGKASPLSPEAFTKLLIQKLGKGELQFAEDENHVLIVELGVKYVYVIGGYGPLLTVGVQGVRGHTKCEPTEEGVEAAAKYLAEFMDTWIKGKTAPIAPEEFKKRRAKIEKLIYDTVQTIDPSGDNTKRWKGILEPMNDRQFAQFIQYLKEKKCQMNVVMPNMKKVPKIANLLKAAQLVGYKTSHRLWLPDRTRPGKRYLTNEKYLVLEIPIRRAQQEWDKKLQVPSRDTHVDALSGQVIMDDKACHLSMPEIQSLSTRGLENTLNELVRVRGGDVMAYGDFNRQLQESGEARLGSLDPRTRARASVISHVLLQAMMIDNNL